MVRPYSFQLMLQIMVSASVIFGAQVQAASSSSFTASPPPDFSDVDARRQLLVDVYLHGQKVGQNAITIDAGKVQFDDPQDVASRLPDLIDQERVMEWLSKPLDGNFDRSCGLRPTEDCGHIAADQLAIIMDEDRFRIDLFIPAELLKSASLEPNYLPDPRSGVSFISRFGAAIAGQVSADASYHVQNQSIIAAGPYRLRADSSMQSRGGLAFDNFAFERDFKNYRLQSGLFWTPGGDFLGRRKIVGAGLVSQVDTRLDRRSLTATPLNVVLTQAARIDLFIEGRLMSSQVYSAGHVELDTSPLPEGSFEVMIRIHEGGRGTREERRFVTKGTDIAPIGRPFWGAFGGLLADAHGRPSPSAPFFNLSGAVRVASGLGVDARALGTNSKIVGEIGAVAITSLANLRGSVLVSSSGDYGLLARATTAAGGPIAASLDLRTVTSQDGNALLPESGTFGTFSEEFGSRAGDRGSYTQGSIYMAATLGHGLMRLTGQYRRSGNAKASYSVGASFEQPVARGPAWNVVANVDLRKTDNDTVAFIGFRALLAKPNFSVATMGGWQHQSGRSPRIVGETQTSLARSIATSSDLSISTAIGRDFAGTYGRAGGLLRMPKMNARGDLLHSFSDGNSPQFAASFDGALVFDGTAIAIGAQGVSDSAIVIRPRSDRGDQEVEVLVNDSLRGRATEHKPLLLFVQPYELHRVRIRPTGNSTSSYDSDETVVAAHPGQVTPLSWTTVRTAAVFGRAVDHRGRPLAKARIESDRDVGQSDDEGYFQVEAGVGERLLLKTAEGRSCSLRPVPDAGNEVYVDAGVQICQ